MRPIKILFLAANPADTARLALDEEVREIQRRLHGGEAGARFQLCTEWAVRADELPAAVMRHKPDIVHFSGHGSRDGELFLSSADGEPAPVAAETLARLFALLGDGIMCVLLNACYSEVQAKAIVATVPSVIGMSQALPEKAAFAFAAGFYEALAFGKSVQSAFELARIQLELSQTGAQRDIPRLLIKAGTEGELVPLRIGQATSGSAPGLAPPLRRLGTRLWPLGVAALAAALFGLYWTFGRPAHLAPTTQASTSSENKKATPEITSAPPVVTTLAAPPTPLAAPAMQTPKPAGPGELSIGSGNDIKAQAGSRVRAGVIGTKIPKGLESERRGAPVKIGSGNRIEAGPGATVETGVIVNQ